jgi:hypothetical protein
VAALGDDEDGEDVLGQLPLRTFSEEDEGTMAVPSPRSDATRQPTTGTNTAISGGFLGVTDEAEIVPRVSS